MIEKETMQRSVAPVRPSRVGKRMGAAILCLVALTSFNTFAQAKPSEMNMEILRDKVKADKKLIVAANMQLTDAEGTAFWPIYEAYQKDLKAINGRIADAIKAYADAYNQNTLTDDTAAKLTATALTIDQDELNLRKSYAAKLKGVIPGKKVARYIQIENKIRSLIRFDLADGIPLVP